MDQFPTEEEEYELRYQDELEMLGEEDQVLSSQPQPSVSKNTPTMQDNNSFLTASPQLSQISGAVNRRLFGTPTGAKRAFSTPIAKKMPAIQEIVMPTPMGELQNVGLSNNKKRRIDRDLFGEIGDLGDITYVDPEAKKKKLEEERDREMIQKVLEARRLLRMAHGGAKKPKTDQLDAIHDFKMRNLSYSVPNWPFIPLQRSDNEKIYCRYHSIEFENKQINEVTRINRHYQGLLGESKQQTWNDAREIVLRRMTLGSTQNTDPSDVVQVPHHERDSNLWVEKYKPRKYIDLLSDEGTNRSLLLWLKMWDKIVFGKEFIPKEHQPDTKGFSNFNRFTGKFEVNGGWGKNKKQNFNPNIDRLGRPIQKVALLCGPPGLGKTTLAHTIARHAGYKVMEMNASDDRSPEAFQMTLENGTQMSSVLNADNRPNCIILDEIDGAPKPSIDFLIRFISDNVVTKAKKKGAKAAKNILRRPIICICNDLYEPSLRQLRQVAFVVTFPPINSSRLAERLSQIAKRERIKTDFGTMFALAEKSGTDVRSCISMLQFFNSLKKTIYLTDVLNNSFGLKDRHRGLFDVWTSIFKIERPQRQLDPNGAADGGPLVTVADNSRATRMRQILDIVHSGGDYEILMQGVYENYLNQKMPDPNLDGVADATKWFCFSDIVQQQIKHLQNYTVYPYLQYGFVVWHLLFATSAWPTVHFPTRGHEFKQKMTQQQQIFASLKKGISCGVIGIGQGSVILVETVPLLKRILSPNIRPVAEQLLTEKEKVEYAQTVNIMVDLGISFNQTRCPDGTYTFVMEPDLDILAQLPDFPKITLSYIGKTNISRDIEIERMRRATPRSDTSDTERFTKAQQPVTSSKGNKALIIDIWDQDKPKAKKVVKDIFGRVVEKTAEQLAKEVDPVVKTPVYFKYKLGFTNAVRRDVFMKELL